MLNSGVADGRLGGGNTLQLVLANKVTELRATYASIPDALSGRMPLAYTQVSLTESGVRRFSPPFTTTRRTQKTRPTHHNPHRPIRSINLANPNYTHNG